MSSGEVLVRCQVCRLGLLDAGDFRAGELNPKDPGETDNDAVLKLKDLAHRPVDLFACDDGALTGIDEAWGDPDAGARFLEATPDNPRRTDRSSQLRRQRAIDGSTLPEPFHHATGGGVLTDYSESRDLVQVRADSLGDARRKPIGIGIAANVRELEHQDRASGVLGVLVRLGPQVQYRRLARQASDGAAAQNPPERWCALQLPAVGLRGVHRHRRQVPAQTPAARPLCHRARRPACFSQPSGRLLRMKEAIETTAKPQPGKHYDRRRSRTEGASHANPKAAA